MHVHAAVLGTTREGRNGLTRIQQALGIEGMLDREKTKTLGHRKLHTHGVNFFNAYPMLPGNGAPVVDADFKNLSPEPFSRLKLTGLGCIKQNERVQVAVARMKDIEATQAVFFFQALQYA